jgi:oxygen-dependent protoporphyrinogen oxidase
VKFVALRHGNGSYGDELARRFDVELGARVHEVTEHDDHVVATWTDREGRERIEQAAGCVLAVPSTSAARMHPGLDSWRTDFLDHVHYTISVSLTAALARPPKDVPASLIFIPRAVHSGLIGLVLDHNKAQGRVPAGKGLVSGYAEVDWARELIDEDDGVVEKRMLDAYDQVLPGLSGEVEFTIVRRWQPTAMYAYPGYYREYERFYALSRSDRRIQLAGDYFMTSNLDTATRGGETAARRLAATLRRDGRPHGAMTPRGDQ